MKTRFMMIFGRFIIATVVLSLLPAFDATNTLAQGSSGVWYIKDQ